MVIAIVLTGSLFLGLLGIGGLVVYRLVLGGPTEVAMPPDVPTPTKEPVVPATPTPSPLPTATPMPAPTATLVLAPVTAETPAEGSNNNTGGDGVGLSSPGPDESEMPETGFGILETVALGLMLVCLLGGTRAARHLRAQR